MKLSLIFPLLLTAQLSTVSFGGSYVVSEQSPCFIAAESSPLSIAIESGNLPAVTDLIKAGAIFRQPDSKTPLHLATYWGHEDIVRYFINSGADPDSQDDNGVTPLHLAAWKGNKAVAKLLLNAGASVDLTDIYNRSPLFKAAWQNQTPVVELLISKGADVNLQDTFGSAPLHAAAGNGFLKLMQCLLSNEVIIVDQEDQQGRTAFWQAVQGNRLEAARLLYSHKANTSHPDRVGRWTPLHVAVGRGYLDMVRTLLQWGAESNPKDKYGWTPCRIAKDVRSPELIEMLCVNNSAGVDLMNKEQEIDPERSGHDRYPESEI
ncbi:MAG: ankyrin repeat domain-containing protein [Deltaproteobacteria bacterium]|nr:ankyrin repeat domain-containing protein [Deltaproteobacteria bacterium]